MNGQLKTELNRLKVIIIVSAYLHNDFVVIIRDDYADNLPNSFIVLHYLYNVMYLVYVLTYHFTERSTH